MSSSIIDQTESGAGGASWPDAPRASRSVHVEWKYKAIAAAILDPNLVQQSSSIADILESAGLQTEDGIFVAQLLHEMTHGEWSECAYVPQKSPWDGTMVVGAQQVKAFATWHLDIHARAALASSHLISELSRRGADVSMNWLAELPYAGCTPVFAHPGPLGMRNEMAAMSAKLAAAAAIMGFGQQNLPAVPLPSQYRELMTEAHLTDHMSLHAWRHAVHRMWTVVRHRGRDLVSHAAFFDVNAVRLRTAALQKSPEWRLVPILARLDEPFTSEAQQRAWIAAAQETATRAIAVELFKVAPRLANLPTTVLSQVIVRAVSLQQAALDASNAVILAQLIVHSGALWISLCTNLVFNDLGGILDDFEVAAIFGYGMLALGEDFDLAMKWTYAWHKVFFDISQRNLAHSGGDLRSLMARVAQAETAAPALQQGTISGLNLLVPSFAPRIISRSSPAGDPVQDASPEPGAGP